MSKLIVALIGYGGAGKTSSAQFLEEHYNFATFTFSSLIREYANNHGIELSKRVDYANTHAEMIRQMGWESIIAKAMSLPNDRICVDDLRSPKYHQLLVAAGAKTISFDCPTKTRFDHVRNHPDKVKYPATFEQFVESEKEDASSALGAGLDFDTDRLMSSADFHIDASKDLVDTYRQLEAIIQRLV